MWRAVTGDAPPTTPLTSTEYQRHGIPWFEYYDDEASAVDGSEILEKVKTVTQLGKEKGDVPMPDNISVTPRKVLELRKRLKRGQVREAVF